MRIPLIPLLEARDATSDKDALGVNLFVEQEDEQTLRAIKRPGMVEKSVRTHAGQGIFPYGTKVYIWDSSLVATAPASLNIGDL